MCPLRTLLLFPFALASAPAMAATMVSLPGAPDPGPFAGETIVVSFDAPNAAGYAWDGAPATRAGSQSGVAAAPAGVTGMYGFVSTQAGQPASATLNTPALQSISFYWGSVDGHNRISLFGSGGQLLGQFSGGQLPAITGNWFQSETNRRVGYLAAKDDWIRAIRFEANGTAFEFDTIAAQAVPEFGSSSAAAAVPEPASWALLIAGFGLVGAMQRRRMPMAGRLTCVA